MDVLKKVAQTRLVIMVTHNPDLAEKYSDRIIRMLDGEVIGDSNPFTEEESKNETDETANSPVEQSEVKQVADAATTEREGKKKIKYNKKHSSMSFLTALRLSAKNLLSKKKRTVITSLAASIGIIGIAIILSVSSGLSNYIDKTMMNSTSFNYISISSSVTSMPSMSEAGPNGEQSTNLAEYPENTTGIYPYEEKKAEAKKQKLDSAFISYLEEKSKDLVVDIAYSYNVNLNILTKNNGSTIHVDSSNWDEALNNMEYLSESYTVLAKDNATETGMPVQANEIALVVDKYNRLSTSVLDSLGIAYNADLSQINYSDLIGKEFRVVFNDGWYTSDTNGGTTIYREANTSNYDTAYADENGITVKVISVLRENKDAAASWLSEGIAYSPALTQKVLAENKQSAVALAQYASPTIDVTTGKEFASSASPSLPIFGGSSKTYESALETLGYTQTPTSIMIYPTNVDNRKAIIGYLDSWNTVNEGTDAEITYMDMSSTMTSMLSSIVDIVTYVLVAFSVTSLVVSSIMIAIIIYASVIERTKEIGVLRSIGARKKDVAHVFEAEAILLGLVSGVAAILITLVLNVIINAVLGALVGVSTIASLPVLTAFGLIALSVVLLLIASLIPARMAAKKEPAVALRTE